MKKLLILIFLVTTIASFSQNKWHIGLQTNSNFTTGLPVGNSPWAQPYKGIYTFTFCYAAGVTLDFNFNEKWNLQTGILFRKSSDRSKKEFSDLDLGLIPRGTYGYKFVYYGIELPLNIKYSFNNKISIGTGISTVFNWQGKSQKQYDFSGNEAFTPVNIPKKLQVAGNLLFNYKINQHLYAGLMGQYFFTTTYVSDFNFQSMPRNYLSLGLNFGYKF